MGGHVFRKYESTVNSPESLRNGEPHPEVKRQESIMRHVYVRMKVRQLGHSSYTKAFSPLALSRKIF